MTEVIDSALTTAKKALEINLDARCYGTIVEIGAGQEVAGQFFRVGAAAGTVAKTMSAYDMQFSDQIYGKAGRYVSRERLNQMLAHEYALVCNRLDESRGAETTFFTYAATVAAKSYGQNNFCHAHIGIRFQQSPRSAYSEIILHARMHDDDAAAQSQALGILGVNLIYGAFRHSHKPRTLIEHLLDDLSSERIEVDFIELSGEAFAGVENRLMNLHLIRSWSTRAVLFDAHGVSQVPTNILRKSPIMIIRGSFRPPTKVHADMFSAGLKAFGSMESIDSKNIVTLAEITMAELESDTNSADADFLARVDLLNALGHSVLVSDYFRFFSLRHWLRNYTHEALGITLSVLDFDSLFNPKFYEGLEGGILEAMGKLFPDNTHVFVYPSKINGKLVTLGNVSVEPLQKHLLSYLIDNKLLLDCNVVDEKNLHISARESYKMMQQGNNEWEANVLPEVAKLIKERKFFGAR
ncbi:MAG: TonB-dependent receptor [Gammaproteobacteria bacterium]|nr:TonB-dependent receptor [Gammaproteobacteria bacterium]NNM11195.1 TonB-dependent receptor [Pseudomonadales bacterium]